MMKAEKCLVFVFLVALSMCLFAAPAPSLAADKVIEIKANAFHPVGHRITEDGFYWYSKEIEKRTNGRVKFKWFLGGSLVPQFKAYDGLKSGICDMAYFMTSLNPNEFPVTNSINLPFGAEDSSHAAAILRQMFQEFPEMRAEYKKVVPMFFWATAPQHVHTKTFAPKTLDELAGMRIGGPGPTMVNYLNILGASATLMDTADLYTSLQRNMIDGVVYPEAPLRSQKLTDIVNHHTMLSLGVDVFVTAMNRDKWNSLPKDIQQVFLDLNQSTGALYSAIITNESKWVIEELKARGDEFYYLPPEEKAKMKQKLAPVYDEWYGKMSAKGLDGKKMLARINEIYQETLKNPYKPDSWWGRAGRKE